MRGLIEKTYWIINSEPNVWIAIYYNGSGVLKRSTAYAILLYKSMQFKDDYCGIQLYTIWLRGVNLIVKTIQQIVLQFYENFVTVE